MKLISVVIPVYNVEPYLSRCVESVRNQTYHNLEIILVDDGSPDNCPQICDDYSRVDHRIKVIHKLNGGLGLARNSGLEAVTGEYVTFVDSDDWISPDHIFNLYTEAVKYQADAVIGSHTVALDEETFHPRNIELQTGLYEGQEVRQRILFPMIGADPDFQRDVQIEASCCMNLYRTNLIFQHDMRFSSEKIAVSEDLFFNVDYMFYARRVVVSNETGYFYFHNHASITHQYDPRGFEKTIAFYPSFREHVARHGILEQVSQRINRTYIMKTRVCVRHIVGAQLPLREKLTLIKQILSHDSTKAALAGYPIDTFIPAMYFMAKLMRNENALGVYVLMILREGAREIGWFKTLLRNMGIGR